MNTNALLPLTAATLFALCTGSMILSHNARTTDTLTSAATASTQTIVDLPTVSVRPDPADLGYFNATQSARIVDLPAVTVTPDLTDLAYYEAARSAERIVTLATVTVRPAAADLAWYVAHQAGQVASVDTHALRASASQIDAQIAVGAAKLVREATTR
ncbi:hypothetical protein [Pseudoxanthomonas sp.]|uniref:hypothetical protein n=1 Tax=Pseudoxanthomonas sp. TaxID=1871049 RepID=UPI00262217B6|nr:hypothetical protein [Pseudoxanthomonas sp.]WDS34839.1 MAG: hypothetical protein O8I58_10640 [Pseudoxanthomonas sp.]